MSINILLAGFRVRRLAGREPVGALTTICIWDFDLASSRAVAQRSEQNDRRRQVLIRYPGRPWRRTGRFYPRE
jgi:hypothetical protein